MRIRGSVSTSATPCTVTDGDADSHTHLMGVRKLQDPACEV